MLDLLANAHSSDVCVLSDRGILSYGQLRSNISSLLPHLRPRTLIILICDNSEATLTAYLACLSSGNVPILVDSGIGKTLLKRLVDLYNPSSIWSPFRLEAYAETPVEKISNIWKYDICAQSPKIHDDLALLLMTSGSTGSPKLVRVSYKNLRSNTESISAYLDLMQSDRHITTLPYAYTYGLSCINTHLWVGASVVLNSSNILERAFWDNVSKFRPTSMAGVPYTYELLTRIGLSRLKSTSIKNFTQAGGALRKDVRNQLGDYMIESSSKIWIMYGQTEATARMSYLEPSKFYEKVGSIGVPIPGGSFSILEGTHEGTLIYHGPNVSMGYAEGPDDLKLGDRNRGRLNTGDIARVDDEGYWYIVGRNSRFIKINGKRVSLDDIDAALESEGFVSASHFNGEKIIVVIETTIDAKLEHAKSFLRNEIAIPPSIFLVKSVEQISRSESGKVLHKHI